MTKRLLPLMLGCLGIFFVFPSNTYAYLDPGTGSAILQALAAGLLAVASAWYFLKAKICNLFKKIMKSKQEQQDGEH